MTNGTKEKHSILIGNLDNTPKTPYNDNNSATERCECEMSGQTSAVGLADLVAKIGESYADFDQSVKDLGNKAKGRTGGSKMAGSFMRWIGGSHVTTPRDHLCEELLTKVQSQLEFFSVAMEGAPEEEQRTACGLLADIMLEPVPEQSNATTNLMRRAMASLFQPYLGYLTREKLEQCHQRFTQAYPRRQMLPVERELVKEMERLLAQ